MKKATTKKEKRKKEEKKNGGRGKQRKKSSYARVAKYLNVSIALVQRVVNKNKTE